MAEGLPSVPRELEGVPPDVLQRHVSECVRYALDLLRNDVAIPEQAVSRVLDQMSASGLQGGRVRPPDKPVQQSETGLELVFGHQCLNKTCLSGNTKCDLCERNPNKRCELSRNFAIKHQEGKQLLAACNAPVKLFVRGLKTPQEQADPNAPSTSSNQPAVHPSDIIIEFSLLDSAKHASKCQGLHDDASLTEEQLKSCEVLDCTSDREKKKDPSASKVKEQLLRGVTSEAETTAALRVRKRLSIQMDTVVDVQAMRNSFARLSQTNCYKLLARAISAHSGKVLGHKVSEGFNVTTCRVVGSRKVAIPKMDDSVEKLEECGKNHVLKLADITDYAKKQDPPISLPRGLIRHVTCVEDYILLRQHLDQWQACPTAFRRELLPTPTEVHLDKAVGWDDRARIWWDSESMYGLMYACRQAQIQWIPNLPEVLMQRLPHGGVALSLVPDLTSSGTDLVTGLARKAFADWQQQSHTGWSAAQVDIAAICLRLHHKLQHVQGCSLTLSSTEYTSLLQSDATLAQASTPELQDPSQSPLAGPQPPPSPLEFPQLLVQPPQLDNRLPQPDLQLPTLEPGLPQLNHWPPSGPLSPQFPPSFQHDTLSRRIQIQSQPSSLRVDQSGAAEVPSWDVSTDSHQTFNSAVTHHLDSPQTMPALGLSQLPGITTNTHSFLPPHQLPHSYQTFQHDVTSPLAHVPYPSMQYNPFEHYQHHPSAMPGIPTQALPAGLHMDTSHIFGANEFPTQRAASDPASISRRFSAQTNMYSTLSPHASAPIRASLPLSEAGSRLHSATPAELQAYRDQLNAARSGLQSARPVDLGVYSGQLVDASSEMDSSNPVDIQAYREQLTDASSGRGSATPAELQAYRDHLHHHSLGQCSEANLEQPFQGFLQLPQHVVQMPHGEQPQPLHGHVVQDGSQHGAQGYASQPQGNSQHGAQGYASQPSGSSEHGAQGYATQPQGSSQHQAHSITQPPQSLRELASNGIWALGQLAGGAPAGNQGSVSPDRPYVHSQTMPPGRGYQRTPSLNDRAPKRQNTAPARPQSDDSHLFDNHPQPATASHTAAPTFLASKALPQADVRHPSLDPPVGGATPEAGQPHDPNLADSEEMALVTTSRFSADAFGSYPQQYHMQTASPSPFEIMPKRVDPYSTWVLSADIDQAAAWINDGIKEGLRHLSRDDIRNCLRSAKTPEPEVPADEDAANQNQLAVVQPSIQHVVIRFVLKMRALARRRRVERGDIEGLPGHLERRLRLRRCALVWAKAVERGPTNMLLRRSQSSELDMHMLWEPTPSDRSESDLMSLGVSLVEEMLNGDEEMPSNSTDDADSSLVPNTSLAHTTANHDTLLGMYLSPWLT